MHLVGQSQNTFREWNQQWTDISTSSFAELESQIFEVEELNERIRFSKTKTAIEQAEATMDDMERQVEEIRAGLKELRESEERNSLEVQKALDVYEDLKKNLREHGENLVQLITNCKSKSKISRLNSLNLFTLNTSGDPVEAQEVLEQAEQHTYEVEFDGNESQLMYERAKIIENANRTDQS